MTKSGRDTVRETSSIVGDLSAMGYPEYYLSLRITLRFNNSHAQLYDEAWPIVEETRNEIIAKIGRETGRQTVLAIGLR